MNILTDMKIRGRLALAVAVPVAGLLVFAGFSIYTQSADLADTARLERAGNLVPELASVIGAVQRERGRSVVVAQSGAKDGVNEYTAQTEDTDKQIARLQQTLTREGTEGFWPDFRRELDQARQSLDQIAALRQGLMAGQVATPDSVARYTGIVNNLLDPIDALFTQAEQGPVARDVFLFSSILGMQERAGLERAAGNGGFAMMEQSGDPAQAQFPMDRLQRMLGLVGGQQSYGESFLKLAPTDIARKFTALEQSPENAKVKEMRTIAVRHALPGAGGDVPSANDWFAATTARIGKLIALQKDLSDLLFADISAMRGNAQQAFWLVLGVTVGVVLIAGIFVVFISRSITSPVAGLTGVMTRLSGRELDIEVPGADRGDEIGDMARSVEIFRAEMQRAEALAAQTAERDAAIQARAARILDINKAFEKDVGEVMAFFTAASSDLQGAARSMTAISETVNQRASAVMAASEQSSTNIQTVASAAEELSGSIGEIANQVENSTAISRQAVERAEGTHQVIDNLSQSVDRVGEVISLIDEIAAQTNLLALNATIEAARAGEAGKGFAVVAGEVKSLANQTARATGDISQHIRGVQEDTAQAVSAIEDIVAAIRQVSEAANSIASAIEEQNAATSEIARNVDQASAGSQEVSSNITGVTGAAGDAGQTAEQVNGAAADLGSRAHDLKGIIDRFVSNVRKESDT